METTWKSIDGENSERKTNNKTSKYELGKCKQTWGVRAVERGEGESEELTRHLLSRKYYWLVDKMIKDEGEDGQGEVNMKVSEWVRGIWKNEQKRNG